jgi:hypothetical protein
VETGSLTLAAHFEFHYFTADDDTAGYVFPEPRGWNPLAISK